MISACIFDYTHVTDRFCFSVICQPFLVYPIAAREMKLEISAALFFLLRYYLMISFFPVILEIDRNWLISFFFFQLLNHIIASIPASQE